MNRITELDGLRTIAILFVIGCHYEAFATSLYRIPDFGWVGVDIFFVLSGFLITSILLRLRETPQPFAIFYARRTLRIFPPYFLVLGVVLGAAVLLRPEKWHLIGGMFLNGAAFFQSLSGNSGYLVRTIEAVRAHTVPPLAPQSALPVLLSADAGYLENTLGHFWSLSVEEWFYILWAPVVLKLSRRGIVGVAITTIAVSLFLRWFGFHEWTWYFAFCCRLDILLLGGLLALWIEQREGLALGNQIVGDRLIAAVSAVATVCLAVLLFEIRPILGREIRQAVAFAAFGTLLIGLALVGFLNSVLRFASTKAVPARFLRSPLMVYVGQRSYMIYLIHMPVYFLVNRLFGIPGASTSSQRWISAYVSLILSISAAALSWRFYESPILEAKERWTSLLVRRVGAI